jgi:uncharacterized protein YggL (DUF469 family)
LTILRRPGNASSRRLALGAARHLQPVISWRKRRRRGKRRKRGLEELAISAPLDESAPIVSGLCAWPCQLGDRPTAITAQSQEPPMNKRLRKKHHLGEFKQLGFQVRADLRPDLADADLDAFFGRWLDVLEQRDLLFSGSAGLGKFEGLVMRAGRASATEEDRQAIGASLTGDPIFVRHEIDELSDAWH